MIARRRVLGATLFGGLAGTLAPSGSAGAEPADISDQLAREVVEALKNLRQAIEAPRHFSELSGIRARQVDFLRAQGKLPDFIDVAVDVWFALHDWHVQYRQPVTIGRDATGRYTIRVLDTSVVLRPDAAAGYIGPAYDSR